jgi:hypothetical protein
MLILILLDQNSNDFHQGNQGRILIFTHFINQIIQYSDKSLILTFCMGNKDHGILLGRAFFSDLTPHRSC